MGRSILVLAAAGLLAACSSGDDDDGASPDAQPYDSGPRDAGVRDGGVASRDGGPVVVHDAGAPIACTTTCNCPQGMACEEGTCSDLGRPIYCCDKAGCPAGVPCVDTVERPATCEGGATGADGGSCRYDGGPKDPRPQNIGGPCEEDSDCTGGLVCWTRDEPPGFWGYCTITSCDVVGCPQGSSCFVVDPTRNRVGCLAHCNVDTDCGRADAQCFELPDLPEAAGVCVTRCRDDVIDCSPRDGTSHCSPASGECAPTPSQRVSSQLGRRCANSVDCGVGEICLGEIGWGLPCGMCGQICEGLAEAVPCPPGSTCQPMRPLDGPTTLGVCFRDCSVDGTCPERSDAVCRTLDGWATPSCVPQP